MSDLTIYEQRTCSTCRRLSELLAERGVQAERVQYHVEGIDEPTIRELLAKAGIGPREALRRRRATGWRARAARRRWRLG